MRDALSAALIEAARRDPKFVLLTGDHGYALFDAFRAEFPDRYINAGIAEQNMVGVAAGMAMAGYHPAVYGLAAFVPIRVLEQIKLDVCHLDLPVTFLGDGAGVVYTALGSSHQCAEDIAALRSLPNMTILSPAGAAEMRACFDLATRLRAPTYIRIGKEDATPSSTERFGSFERGAILPLHISEGARIALLATGSKVSVASAAAEQLPSGLVSVWSAPCIKPLSQRQLTDISDAHEIVVTLEEHSVIGGLGSAVCEGLAERPEAPVRRIGIRATATPVGSYSHAMQAHGLDLQSVVKIIARLLDAPHYAEL